MDEILFWTETCIGVLNWCRIEKKKMKRRITISFASIYYKEHMWQQVQVLLHGEYKITFTESSLESLIATGHRNLTHKNVHKRTILYYN